MPVHDWTRVSAGTFHHFHTSWITEISKELNRGILSPPYYALAEQTAGETIPDVLTLHAATPEEESDAGGVGTAVAVAPPRVSVTAVEDDADAYATRRHTLVIRHGSGDRIVALLEILSPGNKRQQEKLERFLDKAVSALYAGYHLLVIDLLPPGRWDPEGIHGVIWSEFDSAHAYVAPTDRPLTLVAYTAGERRKAYAEPIAVGMPLPDMPLFLTAERYVNVPLERSYLEAYASVPQRWRRVIEGE